MPAVGFDHVVLPTKDSEKFIAFYKGLGFNIIDEEQWRTGETNRFAIQVGDSKINVHPPELTGVMRGTTATPGCGDLCFVWEGTVDQILQMINNLGAEVADGPVRRRGGRNAGQTWATSVYVWDPDGNVLEFMVYD